MASMLAGAVSSVTGWVILTAAQPANNKAAIARHICANNGTLLYTLPLVNICLLPENLVLV
jgi:hypothetical protein